MRLIKFAEAKKAPKRLLRPARSANVATKQVAKSMVMGAGRKGLLWQEQGMSVEGIKQKMEAFGVKLKNRRRELAKRINDNYQKNYLKSKPSTKKLPAQSAESVIEKIREIQSETKKTPPTTFPQQVQTPKSKTIETVIKPRNGGKGLLIGAGVATGAVVLGGLGYGLYRKIRSDKGKKRGSYKNFNFPGQLANFNY